MTLLAIDPGRSFKGEASIGVCLFTDQGNEIWRGGMSWEDFFNPNFGPGLSLELSQDENSMWFDGPRGLGVFERITEVVCENFVNNAQSKGGQRNGTSETIGGIEVLCRYLDLPFTRQEPAALGPAKMHAPAGSWKPLKHLRHEDSAYLHGYEYLVRKGVLQAAGLSSTL